MARISSHWRWNDATALLTPKGGRRQPCLRDDCLRRGVQLRIGAIVLLSFALVGNGLAIAGNPLVEWTNRLFGERAEGSKVKLAPAEGVVVMDLDRPERVRVGAEADKRDFPKGASHYRELELSREYDHVAVRLQVIARPNPAGRGNAAFKPIIYVLDDSGSVRESRDAEPLHIDIRPFRPTRLLACIPLEKARRLVLATPSSAKGEYFQSKPRAKVNAPSKGGFYYETNTIESNLPYVDTGELIVEVVRAEKKGGGC